MNCHKAINYGSEYGTGEIAKIYASAGFDPNTSKYIENYDEMSEEDIEKFYKEWIVKANAEINEKLADASQEVLNECYEWAYELKAVLLIKFIWRLLEEKRLWNYFKYKVTTSMSEGINRVIKGLKWQAYGYRDMEYFKLKIMQKCGYLNSKYHNNDVDLIWSSH